ncbi:reverse transcriptase domain-containing protein [Areca yellow leaf disease phytoplasma]|uniref:reverse transcriptase domain-containing protein n=1 Tax=Areca yellow leaf disease phytoplasma TaxID=927614 RepID=UPI0035B56BD6
MSKENSTFRARWSEIQSKAGVAKGYSQRKGVDYTEVFFSMVCHTSIRVLLSLVVEHDMELEQMDVKIAFLHGSLDEKIYMKQPDGFIEIGQEDKVCLPWRSLYGSK